MAHFKGQDRARYVARMFGQISRRYDRLNTLMTAGRHHAWRRLASDMAVDGLSGRALDVATGTGDFAIDLARRPQITDVVGVDFAPEMLPLALRKSRDAGVADRTTYLLGDAHALPFPDDTFACATVGFGIRNFVDVASALSEMIRVIVPGGRVVILEIVRAEGNGVVSRLFPAYFRHVTPWLGAMFAGNREAYTYLPESVQGFLSASELEGMMAEAGLTRTSIRRLALGTIAINIGHVSQ